MVGTLIESRAHWQRRAGGSIASIVVHGALVAAAVLATARESISASAPPKVEIVHFRPLPSRTPPRPDPTPVRAVDPSVPAAPRIPTIQAPALIPTEIPPIDLGAIPTSDDFSDRRAHGRGVACADPCPEVGLGTDGTGVSPVWAVNDVMMQLREEAVPPRYPERLRQAGIDGSVLVKFVVDTLGRVDPASVEVLRSTHDLFTAAVRESLGKLRFNAAMVGKRKVPAAAMMPFQFTLR